MKKTVLGLLSAVCLFIALCACTAYAAPANNPSCPKCHITCILVGQDADRCYWECPNVAECGYEDWTNHIFDEKGICSICGYVCGHPNRRVIFADKNEHTLYCDKCRLKFVEAHQNVPIDIEATCTEPGLKGAQGCTVCGFMTVPGTRIKPKGHIPIASETIEPTCDTDGLTGQVICGRCKTILEPGTVIPKLGHEMSKWKVIREADCKTKKNGLRERECTRDRCDYKEKETIKYTHKNIEILPGKTPTCTEPGLTEGKKCLDCGKIIQKQKIIKKKDHHKIIDKAVPATCTESGLTQGVHCDMCGTVLKKQEVIAPLGHSLVTIQRKRPTCTETGTSEYQKCLRCEKHITEPEILPPLGHDEKIVPGKEPTCTKGGYSESIVCKRCGKVVKEKKTLPALGHKYGEWEQTKKPTCLLPGLNVRVCERCGNKDIKADAPLGHKEKAIPKKAPTCTDSGLSEYIECERCGVQITRPKVFPALGHDYHVEKTVKPTCTRNGIQTEVCSRCHDTKKTVLKAGHRYAQIPTAGIRLKICTVCGKVTVDSVKKISPDNEKEVIAKAVEELIGKTIQDYYGKPLDEIKDFKVVEVSPNMYEMNVDENPDADTKTDPTKLKALHVFTLLAPTEKNAAQNDESITYRLPLAGVNAKWLEGKELVMVTDDGESKIIDGEMDNDEYVFKTKDTGIFAAVDREELKETVEKAYEEFLKRNEE